jgi:hypothetical protein
VVDQDEGATGLARFSQGVQACGAGADDGYVGSNFRFHGKKLSSAKNWSAGLPEWRK